MLNVACPLFTTACHSEVIHRAGERKLAENEGGEYHSRSQPFDFFHPSNLAGVGL